MSEKWPGLLVPELLSSLLLKMRAPPSSLPPPENTCGDTLLDMGGLSPFLTGTTGEPSIGGRPSDRGCLSWRAASLFAS